MEHVTASGHMLTAVILWLLTRYKVSIMTRFSEIDSLPLHVLPLSLILFFFFPPSKFFFF